MLARVQCPCTRQILSESQFLVVGDEIFCKKLFILYIKGIREYRWLIDSLGSFETFFFPEEIELGPRMEFNMQEALGLIHQTT